MNQLPGVLTMGEEESYKYPKQQVKLLSCKGRDSYGNLPVSPSALLIILTVSQTGNASCKEKSFQVVPQGLPGMP